MPSPDATTTIVCHIGVFAEKYKTNNVMAIIPKVLASLCKKSAVPISPKNTINGINMQITL